MFEDATFVAIRSARFLQLIRDETVALEKEKGTADAASYRGRSSPIVKE